jgi:hypothetical protein
VLNPRRIWNEDEIMALALDDAPGEMKDIRRMGRQATMGLSRVGPTDRIAIVLDQGRVTRWQNMALALLPEGTRCLILVCRNSGSARRRPRHYGYYALNRLTVRNAMTRKEPLATDKLMIERTLEFDADVKGSWQSFPEHVRQAVHEFAPEAVVKFGMGLLRVPDRFPPIISYHHGDPRRFRGRPAGFHELAQGETVMGQMVQILSNALDAGKVIAYCETKIDLHPYRSTLVRAYRHSPLLLRRALDNLRAGRTEAIDPVGKIYSLPTNAAVLRFVSGVFGAWVKRLVYGLTTEKRWEVSTSGVRFGATGGIQLDERGSWKTLVRSRAYTFYADPFFLADGSIMVEALDRRRGKGALVHVGEEHRRVSIAPGHHSYPAPVLCTGTEYLVPEVAGWSKPLVFQLNGESLDRVGELDIGCRVLDPTLLEHQGHIYLFGNDIRDGAGVLRLWTASDLFAPFTEHPASPLLISPRGARMAGAIRAVNGRLTRYGQDGRGAYGHGVVAHEVTKLSPEEYAEHETGELRFDDVSGPHTLNFHHDEAVFDWYRERLVFGAAFRRLLGRFGYYERLGKFERCAA